MGNRKSSKKYFFSVEGETEEWYLLWLRDLINSTDHAAYKVSIDCKIEKDPLKRAKGLVNTSKTEIYHFFDYESDEDVHVKRFTDTMDRMKQAMSIGKQIKYKFGYSNFAFDLWIVLHKIDCNGALPHRRGYLANQLTLEDVIRAIERSERIMVRNAENGYILHNYKGFKYYKENPSLAVWEAIKKIMQDCKLI